MKHLARKRFGQHFLVDQSVIGRIVDDIDPRAGEALVEIGPGLGALTRPLRQRLGRSFTVIEIDRDLAERWRRDGSVQVVEADVLSIDWRALAAAAGQRLRIVGNLPYNISTPILFQLLASADCIVDQHVMLQREVVERMLAAPGGKVYGRLSVMLQWRYEMALLADVAPEAFDPPPQVDSSVVWMRPRPLPSLGEGADVAVPAIAACLEPLVQAAFSQRRKLLRHSLGPWLSRASEKAGGDPPAFDLQRRAEEVPVAEYVQLARSLAR